MLFITPWFLIFSIVTLALSATLLRAPLIRRILLLVTSIFFYYHFAGPQSLGVAAALATVVYILAWIACQKNRSRAILGAGIALSIAALAYFRYTDFIASLVKDIDRPAGESIASLSPAVVPLGISFFAFEFCHYLADVLKGAKPVKNLIDFFIFVFFYPRMAAGPIIRFENLIPQVRSISGPTQDDVVFGLRRLIFGYTKKTFIADPLAMFLNQRYNADAILAGSDVIYLCVFLYVRIYMDFSSYSDMALGLARLWGLKIPENFNFPFLATSPATFWHRWHISLSRWIRDYVYIPLGGNRGSSIRVGLVVLFTMALCGLWHGASWHFVAWGVFHGLLLIAYRALRFLLRKSADLKFPFSRLVSKIGDVVSISVGWALTQACVAVSWLLFFYPMKDAIQILSKLTTSPIAPVIFR